MHKTLKLDVHIYGLCWLLSNSYIMLNTYLKIGLYGSIHYFEDNYLILYFEIASVIISIAYVTYLLVCLVKKAVK